MTIHVRGPAYFIAVKSLPVFDGAYGNSLETAQQCTVEGIISVQP